MDFLPCHTRVQQPSFEMNEQVKSCFESMYRTFAYVVRSLVVLISLIVYMVDLRDAEGH